MPARPEFEARLAVAWDPASWQDVTVLVAVSGGADSVALLRGLSALKCGGEGRLLAAHLNHQLRGEESESDAAFVDELCRQLQIPCEVQRASWGGAARPRNLESTARAARYAFLTEAAARSGARYVVTAHTADDQAETILHRIVRGTGIAGLAGMSGIRPLSEATTLLRPLLGFRRQEILEYLGTLGQAYRHDSSNNDPRFTRNRIRHRLIPKLADQFNADVVAALLRLGRLAGEAQAVLGGLAETLAERCVVREPSGAIRIILSHLADQPPYLVRELLLGVWRRQGWPLQAMGSAQWEQLAAMVAGGLANPRQAGFASQGPGRGPRLPPAGHRKQIFPGGVVAEVGDDQLRLVRPG